MRLIVCYSKEDRVKYISHLDMQRTMQRALRRADIPVTFTEGFNPHPRISFASALSVGVTSEAEYMDIILDQLMEPGDFINRMNAALPKGIEIKNAGIVKDGIPSLMSLVDAAEYTVSIRAESLDLTHCIARTLDQNEILYEKQGKKSIKVINIRDGIIDIKKMDNSGHNISLLLSVGSDNSTKPENVIKHLLECAGINDYESISVRINRKELYTKREEKLYTLFGYCEAL